MLDLDQGAVTHEGEIGFYGNWGAMSPTGDRAAVTGIEGGEVLILDLVTGKPVRPFVVAHPGNVSGISLLARRLPADDRRRGRIGGALGYRDGHPGGAGVAPDPGQRDGRVQAGRHAPPGAGFNAEPAVYVWDPIRSRAIEFACRAAGRELTEEEWSDAFGDLPHQEVCTEP